MIRASAAAWTSGGTPGRLAPDHEHVPFLEREGAIVGLARGRQQDEPPRARDRFRRRGAPRLETRIGRVSHQRDGIEVVHSGATEMPVRGRKAGRLDQVGPDAEAGTGAQHGPGVLGNVGLVERQTQPVSGRNHHGAEPHAARRIGARQTGQGSARVRHIAEERPRPVHPEGASRARRSGPDGWALVAMGRIVTALGRLYPVPAWTVPKPPGGFSRSATVLARK